MSDIQLQSAVVDIDMTNGALSLTSGIAAHAQRADMHYSTFMGESRYDRSAGMPWLQVIFEKRMPLETVRTILDIFGRGIPGIEATDLNPELDRETRKMTVTGTLTTIDGDVDFTLTPLP